MRILAAYVLAFLLHSYTMLFTGYVLGTSSWLGFVIVLALWTAVTHLVVARVPKEIWRGSLILAFVGLVFGAHLLYFAGGQRSAYWEIGLFAGLLGLIQYFEARKQRPV